VLNTPSRLLHFGAALLAACLAWAPAQAHELRVAGTTFAHVFERTADGEFTGLGAELARAMARQQGHTVKFELYPWVRAQEMVAKGRADVLVGPYKTAQREAQLSFMDQPFYQDNLLFYAHAGSNQRWDGNYSSLKNRRIITMLGWVYGQQFDQERAALNITQVATVENGLAMLLNDRTDLFAANERNSANGIAALGPHGEFVALSPAIGREVGYFAFPKDAQHEALRQAFNASFKKLTDSGEYAAMARRLGVTIPATLDSTAGKSRSQVQAGGHNPAAKP
jgi:polar amino acid transport system substrate-binding protein